jgi:hypothetical protein
MRKKRKHVGGLAAQPKQTSQVGVDRLLEKVKERELEPNCWGKSSM